MKYKCMELGMGECISKPFELSLPQPLSALDSM